MNFSVEEDEQLIDLVRNNPPIYLVKSKTYKNNEIKNNIWKKIAAELQKTDVQCKSRWKSIRDYYQRRRKEAEKGSGSASNSDNFDKKIASLRFLDSSFVERQTKTNVLENINEEVPQIHVQENSDIEESQNEERPTNINILEEGNEVTTEDTEQTNDNQVTSNKKEENEEIANIPQIKKNMKKRSTQNQQLFQEIKKGRSERLELMRELVNKRKEKYEEETAITKFFQSMSATVSTFSPELRAEAKMRIMGIVGELELKSIHQSENNFTFFSPSSSRSSTPNIEPHILLSPETYSSSSSLFIENDNTVVDDADYSIFMNQ